jgi:hypothetical protein
MKTTKALFGILTITAALLAQAQAQTFLTNGLVAYYPCSGNLEKWTPTFGPPNAEIKLGSRGLLD